MEYQKIQRAFYELIYEVRKPNPDSLFNNRTFVIWFVATLLLMALLEGRVSKYIIVPAGTLILLFVGYRINKSKLKISFAKYIFQCVVSSAVFMLLFYGLYFILKQL